MVTVLFFTRNQAPELARSLVPLVHDAVEGHISEVIVVDDGSTDSTHAIADGSGCTFVRAGERPLRDILGNARADWIVVLEPGARLRDGWHDAVMEHVMRPGAGAARFRPSQEGNWLSRLFRHEGRRGPVSRGLLISKAQAIAGLSAGGSGPADLARGTNPKRLDAGIDFAQKR